MNHGASALWRCTLKLKPRTRSLLSTARSGWDACSTLMRLAPALSSVKMALEKVAVVNTIQGSAAESDVMENDGPGGVFDEGRSHDTVIVEPHVTDKKVGSHGSCPICAVIASPAAYVGGRCPHLPSCAYFSSTIFLVSTTSPASRR